MKLFGTCVALAVLTAAAAAQPRMGDLVLNEKKTLGHVVSLDRATGLLSTIVAGPISANRAIIGLTMAKNNSEMYLLEEGGPGFFLWSISPSGNVTTLGAASASGEGAPTSCDVMQDGKLVISSAVYQQRDYLRVYDLGTNTYSSLTVLNRTRGYFYQVRVNPDNGNLLMTSAFGSELLEYDMTTNAMRTVVTGIGTSNGVDVEPASGNYVVGGSSRINIVSPAGSIVKTISTPNARRVRVEPSSGLIICLNGTSSGAVNSVVEYDNAGTAVKTHGPYTGYNFTGLDIYGSRQVTGSGPATPGSSYTVDFSFPGKAGAAYFGALALSQRPGILLAGSKVNLAFDGLFIASLQGLFVSKFQGVLDGTGRATGSIQIPAFVPVGITIYCSAVVNNGAVFTTANTHGITIR